MLRPSTVVGRMLQCCALTPSACESEHIFDATAYYEEHKENVRNLVDNQAEPSLVFVNACRADSRVLFANADTSIGQLWGANVGQLLLCLGDFSR